MSHSADNETLRFYQHEAEAYCLRTEAISSPALQSFLERLKPGASILELGCGSGRDTVEMLRLGYDVTPTDGSPEMARQAEGRLRRKVSVLEFSEIEGEPRFDGVWAHACLLHVPVLHLGEVLRKIYRGLKSPGVLFANFKEGTAESRDRLGRYYNYSSLAALREIFQQAAPWFSLEIERSSGQGYDGAAVKWLNCTAIKNEKPPNAGTFAGAACLPTYRHAS
jgi:SAM-dependent methyltransferase